jgi:hypothetical protein
MIRSALLPALAALLSACAASPKVYSSANPTADFASYTTYGFASPLAVELPGEPTPLLVQYLKAATSAEMEARGYRLDATTPDLLVNLKVHTELRSEVRSTPSSGMYFGYRGEDYGVWGGYQEPVIVNYTEGTLNVDLIDAKRNQLAWEGVAEGRLREKARKDLEKAVNGVMAEVFKRYPYTAGNAEPAGK